MAGYFNPYSGFQMNYAPAGYPMPPAMGPMAQQAPQTAQNGPIVLYVPNVSQVKEVDMRGLSKALVVVQNEPVIAMKTADSMGLTSTEYFTLTRFDPDAAAAVPASEYVTRKEFEEFAASLKPAKGKKGDGE